MSKPSLPEEDQSRRAQVVSPGRLAPTPEVVGQRIIQDEFTEGRGEPDTTSPRACLTRCAWLPLRVGLIDPILMPGGVGDILEIPSEIPGDRPAALHPSRRESLRLPLLAEGGQLQI